MPSRTRPHARHTMTTEPHRSAFTRAGVAQLTGRRPKVRRLDYRGCLAAAQAAPLGSLARLGWSDLATAALTLPDLPTALVAVDTVSGRIFLVAGD